MEFCCCTAPYTFYISFSYLCNIVHEIRGTQEKKYFTYEGVGGRKKEDLVSTFYSFFLHYRDAQKLTIWLDNCSSQNKNWCLLSFLVYIVNSDDICAQEIVLNYFEAGHTFMSADSFHHQVELSLKRQKKTYDFEDFAKAVGAANKGNVNIKKNEFFWFFSMERL